LKHHAACRAAGCLSCLLVSHLQSVRRNVNSNASLICSHILSTRTMCFSRRVRLPLIVIAAGASVSAETCKPIYRIRRYCKATSEYSPIHSIGLTLSYSNCQCCPFVCHTQMSPKLSEIDVWLLGNSNRNLGFPIQNLPPDSRSEVPFCYFGCFGVGIWPTQ